MDFQDLLPFEMFEPELLTAAKANTLRLHQELS